MYVYMYLKQIHVTSLHNRIPYKTGIWFFHIGYFSQ